MPSDSKKKAALAKKEAAKKRTQKKPQKKLEEETAEEKLENGITNGVSNGTGDNSGCSTPGELDENQQHAVEAKAVVQRFRRKTLEEEEAIVAKLEAVELENANARSVTGVLASQPRSRDLKIESFSVTFHGWEMVKDTKLELNHGRRYGLVGLNGSGKSTILQAIARREIPIPDQFDIYLLSREIPASDKTALEAVIEVDNEREMLEKQLEELCHMDDEESHEKMLDVSERLEEMGADTAEARAGEILHGLGFTKLMQNKKCRDFSGGWRMRIALARALYLKPSLLLLDEPTNHLDLDACVWLEEELKTYKRCLVIVSHSQDFMNGVCTNMIHLIQQKLKYYGGNYDTFIRTQIELLENQMKRYNWEQDQLKHMKDYVARFGHGSAKLARQAQSKEKTMKKMIDGGLTAKVVQEHVKSFYFIDPGPVPPPVIMVQHVSFAYGDKLPLIYKDLDFGIDLDTRVALVGPNGAGKSTLLKLLCGDIMPTDGLIRRHSHCKLGMYHQHLHEQLDLEMSALEYMCHCYPEVKEKEEMRKIVGRYGLTGRQQTCPMKQLSDGQRCRVSFAWLAWQRPHLLLLDEPTNHLDMESIDALADAINNFEGGMILVSHDFRLVQQVADVIWVCEKQTITPWEGDIFSYKEHLRHRIDKRRRLAEKNNKKWP